MTDPISAVAKGLCDSPEYYEARRPFVDQLVRQRSASRGYSAVLSAPIELYQHQLDTVSRVLSDPVLRYLLADEVGLGKTIEAGLILRQLLLDDSQATVLVSVPVELVHQWEGELRNRLLLDDATMERRLRLVPHDETADESGIRQHSLVVVDEAHRLIPHFSRRPELREDLLHTKGLLLLSATPLHGHISAFLDLLNLVDPAAFPRDDLDGFRERVEQREREATSLQVLASRRANLRQRGAVLDGLLVRHGVDPVVAALVQECRSTDDLTAPAWSDLINYVRETYRISRRMIRHRRNSATTEEYPVAGRQATVVAIADPARAVVDEFLEQYRDHLVGRSACLPFAQAVLYGLGGPRALMHHLERRLAAEPDSPEAVPLLDRALLEATVARLQLTDTSTRLRLAIEVVQERLDRNLKVVVIGTSSDIAREFLEFAKTQWDGLVVEHLSGVERDMGERNVWSFLTGPGGRVLVGDHTLEEGRNLQDAQVLVNLDLPLDPNRLEQRIGRLDRFARRTQPAEIVAFTEPDSDWVTAHLRLLDEGIGVFDQSVATLQRKLGELFEDVLGRLPCEGSRAFDVDLPALRASLEDERVEIDLLEELESVTAASDFDEAGLAELRDAERDVAGLRASFARLTSARGGIGLRPQEDPRTGLVRFGVEHGDVISGVPDDRAEELLPLLARPRTYARDVAISRGGAAPLRIGDPLVDWLADYLHADERGRARAVLRRYAGVREAALWLACDFLIEFDPAYLGAADKAARRRLRRRGDALLPPTIVRTWTDSVGAAPIILEREVLALPFDQGSDLVIRGQVWNDVLSALPDWRQLCRASGEAAFDQVQAMPILTSVPMVAAERASQEAAARLAVLHARSQWLRSASERASAERELKREELLGQALVQGTLRPAVSIIACGAVVLWPAS
ncbi:hypothetical protein HC031_14155 [Planosporangium thailandense]|uniref:Uncharacterized protein n=1 Tax=Planosporangium thailandense TaxID=765197 RepID=A0ABX0XXW5_9ACTN|nr:hypothetical protein [Planosporangium thailandense]